MKEERAKKKVQMMTGRCLECDSYGEGVRITVWVKKGTNGTEKKWK